MLFLIIIRYNIRLYHKKERAQQGLIPETGRSWIKYLKRDDNVLYFAIIKKVSGDLLGENIILININNYIR